MTQLQLTHLRFDCIATAPIKLGGHYAGNSLRNALANVMRRATCPETDRKRDPSPEHAAICPACWLLTSNLDPGTVVRAYAIVPPIPGKWDLQTGDTFAFTLTLFGEGFRYLPYFVLAIAEMGQSEGIGPGRREGRGRFAVDSITAVDPLRGDILIILATGENMVTVPELFIDETAVTHISQLHLKNMPAHHELTLQFLTPLRLHEENQPFKVPDFSVLFRRLLYRVDELDRQLAGQERRDAENRIHLTQLADQVRLVDAQTQWHEMWVNSGRKDSKTPLGGLTGTATYRTQDWEPLLPWLIWGQAIQIGKSTTKGNGVYQLSSDQWPEYWGWMRLSSDQLLHK